MKEKEIMKNIIQQLLKTNYAEAEEFIRIFEYKPLVISEAIEIAKETGTQLDWSIIIKALSNLIKYSIDYEQLKKEVSFKQPTFEYSSTIDETNLLKDYIESIAIDDNSIHYGGIRCAIESIYSDIGCNFTELILDNINLDEFYNIASDLIIENMKLKTSNDQVKEPIASYTISNNTALSIFDIDYFEDAVLVGANYEDAKWYLVQDSSFFYGDVPFSLEEFIRV